jgi:hypothetical protein
MGQRSSADHLLTRRIGPASAMGVVDAAEYGFELLYIGPAEHIST